MSQDTSSVRPSISVVILTYNNPSVLRQCLDSALALDYPDVEIVVVDNASTDDTVEVVRREYGDAVRLETRTENSPVAARNQGFWAAQGTYILSLDHDMIIPDRRMLHRAADLFALVPDAAALAVKICGEDHPDRPLDEHWWYPTSIERHDDHFLTSYFSEGAVVFDAAALRAAGGYDERFFHMAENLDLALKLLRGGGKIAYCPSLLTIELVVSGHVSQRASPSNEYSIRNRLWTAWKHYSWWRAVSFATPRIAVAAARSARYGWVRHFLAGVRSGVVAPHDIRAERAPMSEAERARIMESEGVTIDVPPWPPEASG